MFRNALNARLFAAFGLIVALIALAGGMAGWFTWKTQRDFASLNAATRGSGELGKANHALWQLRYSLARAETADTEGVRKAAAEEEASFKAVNDALDVYGATGLGDEEARALTSLREQVRRYAEVRPQWFRLRIEGNDE
jgi:hypothetical protein